MDLLKSKIEMSCSQIYGVELCQMVVPANVSRLFIDFEIKNCVDRPGTKCRTLS